MNSIRSINPHDYEDIITSSQIYDFINYIVFMTVCNNKYSIKSSQCFYVIKQNDDSR